MLNEVKDLVDLFIEPEGLETFELLDVSRAQELFEVGYEYAAKIEIPF